MKKTFIFAMAAMALTLTSCKDKAAQAETPETPDTEQTDTAAAQAETPATDAEAPAAATDVTSSTTSGLSPKAKEIADHLESVLQKFSSAKSPEELEAMEKDVFTELEKAEQLCKSAPEVEAELEEWGKGFKSRMEELTIQKITEFMGKK